MCTFKELLAKLQSQMKILFMSLQSQQPYMLSASRWASECTADSAVCQLATLSRCNTKTHRLTPE